MLKYVVWFVVFFAFLVLIVPVATVGLSQLIGSSIGEFPDDQAVKSSASLRVFALQLQQCMKPGPHVRDYADRYAGKRPVERLILAYDDLRTRWVYKADESQEHQSAECSLNASPLNARYLCGDCEDFGCLLCSVLAANDLTCRLVLCSGETPSDPHHCFCEVLIAENLVNAKPIFDKLHDAWGLSEIAYRVDDSGVWVALDFGLPRKIYAGQPYLVITDSSIKSHGRSTWSSSFCDV